MMTDEFCETECQNCSLVFDIVINIKCPRCLLWPCDPNAPVIEGIDY